MKELALNILDIAKNSVKAGATLTEISIIEKDETLELIFKDDGCGMTEETVRTVIDPFYTTRTTRKVGLGIPLLKLAAEQTGGHLSISSKVADENDASSGTVVSALFFKNHLDFTPLGDVASSIITLIHGNPDTDFLFVHDSPNGECRIDTRELREVLEDVPLNNYEVLEWIKGSLEEQYEIINQK